MKNEKDYLEAKNLWTREIFQNREKYDVESLEEAIATVEEILSREFNRRHSVSEEKFQDFFRGEIA